MAFDVFKDAYGKPEDGTAAKREPVPDVIQPLADAGIGGIYEDGLVSLLSKREGDGDLGAWSAHLPKGARLFGSTDFGTLFAAMTTRSGWSTPSTGRSSTRRNTSRSSSRTSPTLRPARTRSASRCSSSGWRSTARRAHRRPHTHALSPARRRLGARALKPAKLAAYLGLTGQLFGPGTGLEIEYLATLRAGGVALPRPHAPRSAASTASRTVTLPCRTRVIVDVHVSCTSHLVPRTVAAL